MGYEYKLDIAGVTYEQKDIASGSIEQKLFDRFSVGNSCCAMAEFLVWPKGEIPRMAQIIPYCREAGTEEWTQLGVFFISTRKRTGEKLQIVAYDCMLKSEAVWEPRQELEFPMKMGDAAAEIASLMGTSLDERCVFNDLFTVSYPTNDYVMRDILEYIASAHAGNWLVTAEGKLLLVPMFDYKVVVPAVLGTENGEVIDFGGFALAV